MDRSTFRPRMGAALLACALHAAPAEAKDNYQGLWWKSPGGAEAGWGLDIAHQGDVLVVTWFTYNADGSGLWLSMSDARQTGPGTYSAIVYRTNLPAAPLPPWDFSEVLTAAGRGTLSFTGPDRGAFTYTLDGVTQSKAIERYVAATPGATCAAGTAADESANYQDLWWEAPGGSRPGWGVGISHHGDSLFATWFSHTASGKPQWIVMSNGIRTGSRSFSGTLYRTTGPAFDAVPWNPALVTTHAVGTATFRFDGPSSGTFDSTLDGVSESRPITRYVFALPPTVCR